MKIRVSSGTASYLSLLNSKTLEDPTTAYILVPGEGCRGACLYCPQGKGDSRWLSRVSWPLYELDTFVDKVKTSDLERICLQSPDVKDYEKKIVSVVERLTCAEKPISVSSPPLSDETLEEIKGPVDYIGVGIDAVTNNIRKETKPSYPPLVFWEYLGRAVDVFGSENVTAHIIVGMGEDLEKLGAAVNRSFNLGTEVSLFPLLLEEYEVDLSYYRKAQLLTHMIEKGETLVDSLNTVKDNPEDFLKDIEEGEIFRTRGCPGCNRPYYTSKPGKEHKNYPRSPTIEEIDEIKKELDII